MADEIIDFNNINITSIDKPFLKEWQNNNEPSIIVVLGFIFITFMILLFIIFLKFAKEEKVFYI